MKKNKCSQWAVVGCLIWAGFACEACEEIDEVPPRNENSTSNKVYKMPTPVPLTADETSEIDKIKAEYRENTVQ